MLVNSTKMLDCGIDYRCKDTKTVGELRGDIGAIRWVLAPYFRSEYDTVLVVTVSLFEAVYLLALVQFHLSCVVLELLGQDQLPSG
jgi:hypothetical protein